MVPFSVCNLFSLFEPEFSFLMHPFSDFLVANANFLCALISPLLTLFLSFRSIFVSLPILSVYVRLSFSVFVSLSVCLLQIFVSPSRYLS